MGIKLIFLNFLVFGVIKNIKYAVERIQQRFSLKLNESLYISVVENDHESH